MAIYLFKHTNRSSSLPGELWLMPHFTVCMCVSKNPLSMFISGSCSKVSFLFAISISVWVYFVFFTGWGLVLRMRKHMLTFVSHAVLQCLCSLCDTEQYGKQKRALFIKSWLQEYFILFFFPHLRLALWTLGPAILWELFALIHIVKYACVSLLFYWIEGKLLLLTP